jgi:hypothetical protein
VTSSHHFSFFSFEAVRPLRYNPYQRLLDAYIEAKIAPLDEITCKSVGSSAYRRWRLFKLRSGHRAKC